MRRRCERGSASVTVVVLVVAVWGAGLVGLAVTQALAVRHQVAVAADLAALAGAEAVLRGPTGACAAAARVAAANGAALVDCVATGRVVDVVVERRVGPGGVLDGIGAEVEVRARSRAGPAPARGSLSGFSDER